MPLFTDALIGDTTHLSTEEFGAYMLLLIATWRNNGTALADDDRRLARICRVTAHRWRSTIRAALVGFFKLDDGKWHQKRLEKEWQHVAETSERMRQKAQRKWLTEKETGNADAYAKPMPNGCTFTYKKEDSVEADASTAASPPSDPAPVDPVKELWERGSAVLGGNRALLGKLRKQHGDVAVIEAIAVCEREMPSDPASFLIACLSRAGPANSKSSPTMKLYEGAARAVEAFVQRGIREGRIVDDKPPPVALLDGGRSPGEPPGAD